MKRRIAILSTFIATCLGSSTLVAAEGFPSTGQCTPAEVFAPGQISTPDLHQSRLTFSPDRRTVYWAETADSGPPGSEVPHTIMTAYRTSSGWSMPTVAPFSGIHIDSDPHVTLNGRHLIFSSSRPGSTAPYPLNDLWITHRTANGWSDPVNLGPNVNSAADELYASTDWWGNLYFASDRKGGQWDLYRSRRRFDGSYAPAESLGPGPNHPQLWEFNPEISPSGRTLLYASHGRSDSYGDVDLYVSRIGRNGKFGNPVNLGPCVNTAAPEFHPTVLWERRQLYFVRVNETLDFMTTPLDLPNH